MPCFPHPENPDKQICIPDLILRYDWFDDDDPWPRRLLNRVRSAVIALVGPRPSPWRALDAAVSRETQRELAVLSTLHMLAGGLSPALGGPMQTALRESAVRNRLSSGAATNAA